MEKVDKKTKTANQIFFSILILLILGSAGVTFWKIVIQKDYQIVAETSCNPRSEKCFVHVDEESGETSYYKIISKKANTIALCEATVRKLGCDTELRCTKNEASCFYTFCDPDNLGEGEACSE